MENLLEIRDLTVELMSVRGIVYALSGVDLSVRPGEIHGLVGESGCGKSMTAKSVLRVHDPRRSRMKGTIRFDGRDLLALSNREMEKLRGREIAMIFQDPMTSLNPLMTIGDQIGDMFRFHTGAGRAEARERRLCRRRTSMIWSPTEKRGSREVMGSWKIMAMFCPLIFRMARALF